jgi:hypothetical protein
VKFRGQSFVDRPEVATFEKRQVAHRPSRFIDETLDRLRKRGAQLVGEIVQYQDSYRLCYIRGPEGLLIGLAQELN